MKEFCFYTAHVTVNVKLYSLKCLVLLKTHDFFSEHCCRLIGTDLGTRRVLIHCTVHLTLEREVERFEMVAQNIISVEKFIHLLINIESTELLILNLNTVLHQLLI